MVQNLLADLKLWAAGEEHIESLFLVGSYARGTQTDASDIDVCVITTERPRMLEEMEFIHRFGRVEKQQIEYYGACTSVRAWYAEGFEVEYGLLEPSWIDVPLDAGTAGVLRDGYRVLIDKKNYFKGLAL